MPIPKPKSGESKEKFISRCMGDDNMSKYKQDQRSAICYDAYNNTEKSNVIKTLKNIRQTIGNHIYFIEKQEKFNLYKPELDNLEIEIRKDIKDMTEEGFAIIKDVFMRCRDDGNDYVKSYNIAKSFYNREYIEIDRIDTLRSIETVLKGLAYKVNKARKKIEIGETTKRKDGTYKKVGEGKFVKVKTESSEHPLKQDNVKDSIIDHMPKEEYKEWVSGGDMKPETAMNLYNKGLINESQYEHYTKEKMPKYRNQEMKDMGTMTKKISSRKW